MARIELVRSGGFAGVPLRAVVDTADEPDGGWYDGELAALDLPALASSVGAAAPAGPGEPDRFVYELDVQDQGMHQRMAFGESALPEALRPLVDRLVTRARGGRSSTGPATPERPG